MRHDYRVECEACGALEQHEGDHEALFLGYSHSECGFEVDPIELPMCAACIDNPEAVRTVRESFAEHRALVAQWEREREALAQLRSVV